MPRSPGLGRGRCRSLAGRKRFFSAKWRKPPGRSNCCFVFSVATGRKLGRKHYGSGVRSQSPVARLHRSGRTGGDEPDRPSGSPRCCRRGVEPPSPARASFSSRTGGEGAQMVESSGEPARPLDGPTAMPQWWTLFGRRHTAVRSQLRSQPSFRSLRPGRRFGR